MQAHPKPSARFAAYVRKIDCGDWQSMGLVGGDKGVLKHTPTGKTVAYNTHDGGNDWNGPRNFALQVQRICGCQLIQPRGRKRSRKSPRQEADAQVERSRREHAETWDEKCAERERARADAKRHEAEVKAIQAADRRRREIEDLMR